jgi:hypothetical protein
MSMVQKRELETMETYRSVWGDERVVSTDGTHCVGIVGDRGK